jgi:GntR family transcriptional regulator
VYSRVHTGKPLRSRLHTGGLAVLVPIDHDSPVPLHEQVAAMLRTQIARGKLTGRVPSILTLAQQHDVSHRTTARALETLRDEGLIVSVRGKGYYVAAK